MPWTASDAKGHTKKADTAKKQQRWAKVANDALKRCLADGRSQDVCEASAIRQANAVIAEADVEPGGPEMCVCPDCDYEVKKKRGTPCRSMECPECGSKLVADTELSEADKTVGGKKYPASDFLVVEDSDKPSTWHLQVKKNGKPDHTLMGGAKAALTSPGGHRGNVYEGPKKAEAIRKLKALYKAEDMEFSEAASLEEWGAEAEMPIVADKGERVVPWGVFSFDALADAREVRQAGVVMDDLLADYRDMFRSILDCFSLTGGDTPSGWAEKISAIRKLTDEMAVRLKDAGAISETGMAEIAENIEVERVSLAENDSGHALSLAEADSDAPADSAPLLLDVVLIEPGWGNKARNFYYPAHVIERDAGAFVGAKMYTTDHKKDDYNVRNEVSQVLDIVGKTPSGAPIARVGVFDEHFADTVRKRDELGILDGLQCSILADGTVRKGSYREGDRVGQYVESIDQALSVDWVTRAGAGGHAIQLAENDEEDTMTEKEGQVLDAPTDEAETKSQATPEDATESQAAPEGTAAESAPVFLEADTVKARLAETDLPPIVTDVLAKNTYADEQQLKDTVQAVRKALAESSNAGQPTDQGPSKPSDEKVTPKQRLEEYDKNVDRIWEKYGLTSPE